MPLDQTHVQPWLVGRAEYRQRSRPTAQARRANRASSGIDRVHDLRLVRIDGVGGIGDERGRRRGEERR
jgi:hypothetical protein